MDTMENTKIVGGLCGALLVFLLLGWAGEAMYHVGTESHGDEGDEHAMAYPIEVEETGGDAEVEDGPDFATLLASADAGKGERVFAKCKACHKVEAGANGTGPTLHAVVGRTIGGVDGYGYSAAMADHGGTWDAAALDAFLTKPSDYVPGTKMSFAGLKKVEDRANLVAYLETLN